jgi:hypothetical protein
MRMQMIRQFAPNQNEPNFKVAKAVHIAVLTATLVFTVTKSVHADAVTDWNAITVQVLTTASPPRPGPFLKSPWFSGGSRCCPGCRKAVSSVSCRDPGRLRFSRGYAAKAAHEVCWHLAHASRVVGQRLSRLSGEPWFAGGRPGWRYDAAAPEFSTFAPMTDVSNPPPPLTV